VTSDIGEIGRSIKRLQMRHHRALNASLAPLGLTIVQWDALRHIDENPGVSLHLLAELTYQSDQAFGTLAGRMIERGLIERVDAPGRAVQHRLTKEGVSQRRRGNELVISTLASSFSALSPAQLADFHDALRIILATPLATNVDQSVIPTST
jgi:DNA-binding MarR family transcriptional regulator